MNSIETEAPLEKGFKFKFKPDNFSKKYKQDMLVMKKIFPRK